MRRMLVPIVLLGLVSCTAPPGRLTLSIGGPVSGYTVARRASRSCAGRGVENR